MGIEWTIALLVLVSALIGWCHWRARRPYEPGSPPLIPYALLQYVGLVLAALLVAHLISIVTGKPFTGRFG